MDKILSRTSWEEIRAFRTSRWVLQFLGIFVHTLFLFHDHKQAFMRTLYLLYILATIYSSMSCLGLRMSLTHWRLNFHNFRFWNFSNSPSREKKNLFSPKNLLGPFSWVRCQTLLALKEISAGTVCCSSKKGPAGGVVSISAAAWMSVCATRAAGAARVNTVG